MNNNRDLAAEARAVKVLSALAHTSRLQVFRLLVGSGPDGRCPGQIADALEIPANALSFHLKELHHCGLITQQREGRFLRYRPDMNAMRDLMLFLTAHCCDGEFCEGMPVVDCSALSA